MDNPIRNSLYVSGDRSVPRHMRHLFAGLLEGFGAIYFMGASMDLRHLYKDTEEALQYDWEMVGKDMADALKKYVEEQTI